MVKTSEESPSVCFVEGFKFKKTLESLGNHLDVLRRYEEVATATPLESEIVKNMEINIKQHLEKLREAPCMSAEMRNAVGYETTFIEHFLEKRDWKSIGTRLTELEVMMETW